MRTTNIWAWNNVKGWEIRHREVPKHDEQYWLDRHRDAMLDAGVIKPLLCAQIKTPAPLIIKLT